jgi:hypothetical protein
LQTGSVRALKLLMPPESAPPKKTKRAGPLQVAATILWALFAIGKKNTWRKDGATVTPAQIVIGAFIGLFILIALLVLLVSFVTR